MKPEEILQKLEEIAQQISLHVHYDEMKAFEFHVQDGGCKLRGEPHLFIDRRRPVKEKISILVQELGKCNLEGLYIHPYIRERILNFTHSETMA